MTKRNKLLIIGAGVTGAATAYVASNFSPIAPITVLEAEAAPGMVNSHPRNNSQTSHDGSTETNHDLKEALRIRPAAIALRRFLDAHPRPGLHYVHNRMVLGVGEKEVVQLRARYEEFKEYYNLELLEAEDLRRVEPKLMEGRNSAEPVVALSSPDGYAVNYQLLSQVFLEESPGVHVAYNTKVERIKRSQGGYKVYTNHGSFETEALVCAMGPYSLLFAQTLGLGEDLGILPVAGSFFSAGPVLEGKVYTVQLDGIPFAALHGDPDVLNERDTRFGPTVKVLPRLVRADMWTTKDWMGSSMFSFSGAWAFAKMFKDPRVLRYAAKSFLYDTPGLGKYLFLRDVRKIVPSLRYRDLKLRKGAGGIRPQIVDLKTGETALGESTLYGENAIFSTTPSPGASVCLWNARTYVARLCEMLGEDVSFNQGQFDEQYSSPEILTTAA